MSHYLFRFTVAVVLSALLIASIGSAQTLPAKGEAAFKQVLNKMDSAEKRQNIMEWARIVRANSMPYFKMITPGSSSANIDQTVSQERSFLTSMQSIRDDSERITSFDVSGNLASAGVSAHQIAYVRDDTGELGRAGILHKFEVDLHLIYALTWSHGAWKMQSVTTTPQSIRVDGVLRPIPELK